MPKQSKAKAVIISPKQRTIKGLIGAESITVRFEGEEYVRLLAAWCLSRGYSPVHMVQMGIDAEIEMIKNEMLGE